ncbi:hypothetical protein E1281_25990 [Actinomadura sp. KC345]|uniref:hypothetical protein n=1 Tax=Actinomadura sp. KC345 TaxID=2530371 RepID=UPI0010439F86|nr:hypothetical protein [Actinomadura sp. KC345]TDC47655.1 hypothetical protein E1281_25990 [Actinomadura sp. KC345]
MTMSKSERDDLAKVAKLRARVAKSKVASREAELLAETEELLAASYKFDDEAWADVTRVAQAHVDQAAKEVAERCRELGIPDRFAPSLSIAWYGRGENALASRRAELRKVAQTRIAAAGKQAKLAIDAREAEVLTELIAGGLESSEAKTFLESIPTPEQLMPSVTIAELEADRVTQMRTTTRSRY